MHTPGYSKTTKKRFVTTLLQLLSKTASLVTTHIAHAGVPTRSASHKTPSPAAGPSTLEYPAGTKGVPNLVGLVTIG